MFKTLSVLVPVYNEKNTIEECLNKILSADTSGLELQIIVSDNNSTDGTREILSSFKHSKVKCLFRDKNNGKGANIKNALKHAEGDIFLAEGVLTCGKNMYPFTRIKGIIRGGMLNSFEVTLVTSEHSNLELEIRVEDSSGLFKKFNELKSLEINTFDHTKMRDQINFVKDRLGIDRF